MTKELLLFIDTETTGVDSDKHRIIQCYASIPELGKDINIYMSPSNPEEDFIATPRALDINGIDILKNIRSGVTQRDGAISLSRFIKENIKYKAKCVAHNAPFDKSFIETWFKREGMDFASNFQHQWIDTLQMADFLKHAGVIKSPNLKLTTLCEELGINLENAHDASSDTKATVELFRKFSKMFSKETQQTLAGFQ